MTLSQQFDGPVAGLLILFGVLFTVIFLVYRKKKSERVPMPKEQVANKVEVEDLSPFTHGSVLNSFVSQPQVWDNFREEIDHEQTKQPPPHVKGNFVHEVEQPRPQAERRRPQPPRTTSTAHSQRVGDTHIIHGHHTVHDDSSLLTGIAVGMLLSDNNPPPTYSEPEPEYRAPERWEELTRCEPEPVRCEPTPDTSYRDNTSSNDSYDSSPSGD